MMINLRSMSETRSAKAVPDRAYHHGNLRAALLDAGEAELKERGIEKFSLRSVAKRAGVSHAAPAHHFGDADGLLTALAARSFERHLDAMRSREAAAPPEPLDRMVAAGLAYVDYAATNPAMFDLQFASQRPNRQDSELAQNGDATFGHLLDLVDAVVGGDRHAPQPGEVAGAERLAYAHLIWAVAHGIAALYATRESPSFVHLTAAEKEAQFRSLLTLASERLKPV